CRTSAQRLGRVLAYRPACSSIGAGPAREGELRYGKGDPDCRYRHPAGDRRRRLVAGLFGFPDAADSGAKGIARCALHQGSGRLAPRTLARRLSAMRQFFRFLLSEGARPDDPTAGLDSPRLGRPLPKVLSEAEVERLIGTAAVWPGEEGVRLRCLLELLYATGLRVSELVGLPFAAAQRDPRLL